MNLDAYLDKMKSIQQKVLDYIDNEDDSEDKFQNVKDFLAKNKIEDNQYEFKPFLYFLLKISNNHHRTTNFFSKIERILEYLKDDLRKFYSNSELFHIFGSSKRILLFLVEAKIMVIDDCIVKQIIKDKYSKYMQFNYPQYFQPEIKRFINKKWFPKYDEECGNDWVLEIEKEIAEDFYERRKIGENDHFICELIRKDSLDEFIVYMNKNNFQFNSTIKSSIYETNYFLLKKEYNNVNPSLIEYAAFFGSIQIFNYLKFNKAELTPSLWHYAIHGKNAEIIQIIEENRLKSYREIFKESIKCHHNDIANYIQSNYPLNETKEKEEDEDDEESNCEVVYGIKYHNFKFIKKEQINNTVFNYLCEYDYYTLVSILLNTMNIDINHKTILKNIIHF